LLAVTAESVETKKKAEMTALLDSGCIDETYAREQGWHLQKIKELIVVEYADGLAGE
jgi:hypothetical protein